MGIRNYKYYTKKNQELENAFCGKKKIHGISYGNKDILSDNFIYIQRKDSQSVHENISC